MNEWMILLIIVFFFIIFSLIYWIKKKKRTSRKSEKKQSIQWSERLSIGLEKTKKNSWLGIKELLGMGSSLSKDQLLQLEEMLLSNDLSTNFVDKLIEKILQVAKTTELSLVEICKQELKNLFKLGNNKPSNKIERFREIWTEASPFLEQNISQVHSNSGKGPIQVLMMVGINGAGKTTTVGKVAYRLSKAGQAVSLVAGDTFRAAASEQLSIWAQRSEAQLFQGNDKEDPSALSYRGIEKSLENKKDWCIIDTAGRLHQQEQLMSQLKKNYQVVLKQVTAEQVLCLLVLDAMQGKSMLRQAQEFNQSIPLDGIILTKCDGSAKAAMAIEIVSTLGIPVLLCGVGEQLEDIDLFNPELFVETLLA